jgi:hypothetical protein
MTRRRTRLGESRRRNFGAVKTIVDGIKFDSGHEARRYSDLKLLERAGEISDLELQPRFRLGTAADPVKIRSQGYPNGRRCSYKADFRYKINATGAVIVEDAKGHDTDTARLRRAFVEWQYKIRVVLI